MPDWPDWPDWPHSELRLKGLTAAAVVGLNGRLLNTGFTMAPTYRPHKVKRIRKCGFRSRCKTRGGRDLIKRRRARGRTRLALLPSYK